LDISGNVFVHPWPQVCIELVHVRGFFVFQGSTLFRMSLFYREQAKVEWYLPRIWSLHAIIDESRRKSMNEKLMLVYHTEARRKLLEQAVEESGYGAVACVALTVDLEQALLESGADLILLDVDHPDEELLTRLHRLSQQHPRPIVVFAQRGDRESITEAVNAGVVSYVVDGLAPERMLPIIEAALARFKAFQALRRELHEARSKLEDRKHIDRAKGILMQQKKISEDQAYQALRKLAMDRNIKVGEAACNVIAMAELFG
jgi:response regulator NasT